PHPAYLGANLTYTITVHNTGPNLATGVTLTNLLPPTVSLISAVSSQGSCANSGNTVACLVGNLSGGSNATMTLLVHVDQSDPLTNQAAVYRAESDPYLPNNTALTITPVVAPSVSINNVGLFAPASGSTNALFS